MNYEQRMTRRKFIESALETVSLVAMGAGVASQAGSYSSTSHVIAGAIRWDAWYKRVDASVFAQRSLSSQRYYRRAPFYCEVNHRFDVNCVGTAAEMELEIAYAAGAGLRYWAFVWYPEGSSLRTAWTLYSQSPSRNRIKWCGIVSAANLGSVPFRNGEWQSKATEWLQYMRQPNYQRVDIEGESRPLLYFLWDQPNVVSYFANDLGNVHEFIEYLTSLLKEVKIAAPYVVVLDSIAGATIAREIGAQGISNYMADHKGNGIGPWAYAELDRQAREYWASMAATGVPMVPIVQVGWDTRPRQERPVPWEHPTTPRLNPVDYFVLPTPRELASHVKAAVEFVHVHPRSCPSRLLLIYSWDECDEGGGLIPTLGDPKGAYLSAIKPIIS